MVAVWPLGYTAVMGINDQLHNPLLACIVSHYRRSGYREERLHHSATEKYYSTPNVVDLPSADELRFYYDETGGASKDAQTVLPLTRVNPTVADCSMHSACRASDQTSLADAGGKVDEGPGIGGMTCVCSTAHHSGGGFVPDCGRHQRTVLLLREHSVGYDT